MEGREMVVWSFLHFMVHLVEVRRGQVYPNAACCITG